MKCSVYQLNILIKHRNTWFMV
uniref:Uncharacterized protein n=1 Tax=Anguilla anguilla TaxID=7936 RepID=A0A0E9RCL6_ANGAN